MINKHGIKIFIQLLCSRNPTWRIHFHKNIELMLRLMLQRRVVRYTILTEMLQSHFLAIEQSRKQKTYVGRKYVLACCTIPTRKNFQHIFFAPSCVSHFFLFLRSCITLVALVHGDSISVCRCARRFMCDDVPLQLPCCFYYWLLDGWKILH